MKLFVLILNRTEKLDDLMAAYAHAAICGALDNRLHGNGARCFTDAKHDEEEISFFGSIRKYLTDDTRNDEQDRPYRHKGGSA